MFLHQKGLETLCGLSKGSARGTGQLPIMSRTTGSHERPAQGGAARAGFCSKHFSSKVVAQETGIRYEQSEWDGETGWRSSLKMRRGS